MKDIYWSTDDETYNLDSLEDVIENLLFDNFPGELIGVEVSYGTATPWEPTSWVTVDDILELVADRAYDEAGEWSEDFPDVSAEAKEELRTFLADWSNKNLVANFYAIKETKNYTITKEDVDRYLEENPNDIN